MSFLKSKGFKYFKNLIIGLGAAVVLLGALFKINSWEGAEMMLIIGLTVEAGIFALLGVLGPEPDYYWDKLYPGLAEYDSQVDAISYSSNSGSAVTNERMEDQLDTMISELSVMSKSLSSLKALQEVDFAGTGEQIKKMGQFYSNLNEAMSNINESIEDTKVYREQLAALNNNLGSLNSVYGNILTAMSSIGK